MRLSEAIMLGSTIMKPGHFHGGYEYDPSTGCAIELALAAVGRSDLHYSDACQIWPWLEEFTPKTPIGRVIATFDMKFREGLMTLEEFVDYVRSMEPQEVADEQEAKLVSLSQMQER